ncbi:hypothetical protein ASPZODRAFT_13825 [Penicilliopsis zonata CBS 506.65]|uniref:AB hydrolase-1 domain-containing protein n=1 Tax=Penicilliopsis zonata CBS 506.65 TaxID=1073090 RepID=A0A1L9SPV5_9EURO|nr:hypothetical protein ASPZODRAFT_13825 [Penicilliopsis zonata CBS 506.65]OJJ49087.1 hypothetical protein ASPZODRAFT_13825 [Penicilliopsis zonata CBS 506.65]
MAPPPPTAAEQYLAQDRFNRRFIFSTTSHGDLPVTYADVGVSARDAPVVLFIPGMVGSRYFAVDKHAIAEKMGVRMLLVDKFGMGGTPLVPLDQRLSLWCELVPQLLAHLSIQHVTLIAHSAGTIYLLNTLARCPQILYPSKPSVVLLAPWVDPVHSGVTLMQCAQYLPTPTFRVWNNVMRFFALNVSPMLSSSGDILKSSNTTTSTSTSTNENTREERARHHIQEEYGLSIKFQHELEKTAISAVFNGSTAGANADALLCLRKGPGTSWAACDDYAAFVTELVDTLALAQRSGGESGPASPLLVRAYFAESDRMIGRKGQAYFEDCWQKGDGEFLRFESRTIPETDHETLLTCSVIEEIFELARSD